MADMNLILQLRDTVSARECSLRLEPSDAGLTLGALLERYLRNVPIDRLLEESRITQSSADALFAIQDLVYASDDAGRLMGMFDGVAFTDSGRAIGLDWVPDVHQAQASGREIALLDISIDRIACGYDRNWRGFHARKWQRAPERYQTFVHDTLGAAHGEAGADEILRLDTTERKLKFVESLARRIWHSPFENYSRFTGRKLVYKSGDETIDNILDGGGAICSEKVQALKFLTDRYGLESEYLIAGPDAPGPAPVDKLREILRTFDASFRQALYALLAAHCPALPHRRRGCAGGRYQRQHPVPVPERRRCRPAAAMRRQAAAARQDDRGDGGFLLSPGAAGHTGKPVFRPRGLDVPLRPDAGVRQRAGPVPVR